MRIKIVLVVSSVIICLTLLTTVFSDPAMAESARLQIVGTPSYHLSKAESNPSRYYYVINVTFYNSGDEQSVPVDIKLYEDGKPTVSPPECQGIYFSPYEYKNFTFNWSTTLSYKMVEIRYMPSNPDTLATQYNSGNKTIEIRYKTPAGEKKTPGFEFSFVILIIFSIFVFLKRIKVKKYN